MATKVAIAKMRIGAMRRIVDAMAGISALFGIPNPTIPTQGRDPDILNVRQLEAFADFFENLAGEPIVEAGEEEVVGVEDVVEHFVGLMEFLTVDTLSKWASDAGVEVEGRKKADYISALVTLPALEVEVGDLPEDDDGEPTSVDDAPVDDQSDTVED